MKTKDNSSTITRRELKAEVAVIGGGLAGLCAAVAAARHGANVILVHDRPMLGGNASSECRVGILGAKDDDVKETGLLEEMQLDNFRRNPLLRYTVWDDVMLSLAISEPNLKLLLNTSVRDVVMDGDTILSAIAWNSTEYTEYTISAAIFIDCSGDGIMRLSGAEFRIGREAVDEFGEDYVMGGGDDKTMGTSLLLQLRLCDKHRPFIPPPWAHKFTDKDFEIPEEQLHDGQIHSYKKPYPDDNNFWWIEFGGNLDTVADAGDIQLELKKIAYGVWDYMKNHPDGRCRNFELDWIGSLPSKRESCRFIGDHLLTQHDIVEGGDFPDVVCYGGWTFDELHPDSFYCHGRMSTHPRAPIPFGIPYRCLYSRNISNLMFAGRNISCTHIGLSTVRVMATCALLGQAAGTAAAIAVSHGCQPRGVYERHIAELQATLEDDDVLLPNRWRTPSALTQAAKGNAPILQNGIDRNWKGEDNGCWLAPGEYAEYSWDSPQGISSVRLVFDSVLSKRGKRMPKLEGLSEYHEMPGVLTRAFHIDIYANGEWQTVHSESDVIHRLVRFSIPPVNASRIRLVIDATWGAPKAHVFAMDVV